jgi:hypothetical protein
MTAWIMPVVIGGLMLYGKNKASAAYRWMLADEASILSMPVALLLTKLDTGEKLPDPTAGYRWKPIDITFAASPFTTPEKMTVHVLEKVPDAAATPAAVSGFLTSQSMMATAMHGFLTSQAVEAASMHGFLDKETALMSPHVGEVLKREEYLYSPQTAPDFGGMEGVLGELGLMLRRRGLVLAPVGPHRIQAGDYVVSTGNVLYQAIGAGTYREIHPYAGRIGPLRGRFQMAYGVRRA